MTQLKPIERHFTRDKSTDNNQRITAKPGEKGEFFGAIYVPFSAYPSGATGAAVHLEFTYD